MNSFRSRSLVVSLALLSLNAWSQPAQQNLAPATKESAQLPSLNPLVDSVKAAVVNVDVVARQEGGGGQQFFDQFFGGSPFQNRERLRQGMGSGFIVDPKGIVLTNNHVVEGAQAIRVRLDDGRSFEADILGRDPATDIAVIKLKGKIEKLPSVKLGDSDATRVGDWVVAIGNPLGLASSVSLGIVSAKARQIKLGSYDDFIQTDAAINFGNSGGPLFNMKGEVVGMNTAIAGNGATGIGFAVPSNMIRALLPQLQEKGSVTRGWLGIAIQDLTADLSQGLKLPIKEGALVVQVNEGSPAKKAGLRDDDVVVAVDGEKIATGNALTRLIALKAPGSVATLTLFRGGKQQDVKVNLGTRPNFEGERKGPQRRSTDEAPPPKQRIGLVLQDVDPRMAQTTGMPAQGAMVTDVVPGTPAERAELQPGMVVVEAGDKPVKSADDLLQILRAAKSNDVVLLRVVMPGDGGKFRRAIRIP
jgi:serine protease Do